MELNHSLNSYLIKTRLKEVGRRFTILDLDTKFRFTRVEKTSNVNVWKITSSHNVTYRNFGSVRT